MIKKRLIRNIVVAISILNALFCISAETNQVKAESYKHFESIQANEQETSERNPIKCSVCGMEMSFLSADNSSCLWRHPESECKNSGTDHKENHSWTEGNCIERPACIHCGTEKPGTSVNSSNHLNIKAYPGTCSQTGGNIPYMHCSACDAYFDMTGNRLNGREDVLTNIIGCSWLEPEWEWNISEDMLGTFTVQLKCSNCGKEFVYNSSPVEIDPENNPKTTKPSCTAGGKFYYDGEFRYDGKSFKNEYVLQIGATGHSFSIEPDVKMEVMTDNYGVQYHFMKCTNVGCPDNGKVGLGRCSATGENIAKCGSRSRCDICRNPFGDTVQHNWSSGKCSACGISHSTHEWKDGVCSICQLQHNSHKWDNGVCTVCKYEHQNHKWVEGFCKECGAEEEKHTWENGVCSDCGTVHIMHEWENGACSVCGLEHNHSWRNGVCSGCNYQHENHEWNEGTCNICSLKHENHEWSGGICDICGLICIHEIEHDSCIICGETEYKIYVGSTYTYTLHSDNQIFIKTNGKANRFRALLIDGVKIGIDSLIVRDGEVTIRGTALDGLSVGTHTVVLRYEGGEVSMDIEILQEEPKGATTVSGAAIIAMVMCFVVLTGAACIIVAVKKGIIFNR